MIIVLGVVAALWLLFGAYLLGHGVVRVGSVNQGPLPTWLVDTIVYFIAVVVGPPLWAYVMLTGKDVG